MAFSNEDYSGANILKFSKEELQAEVEQLLTSNEASALAGYEAEVAGDMGLAFAHAADMGVDKIKHAILEDAIRAKELADQVTNGEFSPADLLSVLFGGK